MTQTALKKVKDIANRYVVGSVHESVTPRKRSIPRVALVSRTAASRCGDWRPKEERFRPSPPFRLTVPTVAATANDNRVYERARARRHARTRRRSKAKQTNTHTLFAVRASKKKEKRHRSISVIRVPLTRQPAGTRCPQCRRRLVATRKKKQRTKRRQQNASSESKVSKARNKPRRLLRAVPECTAEYRAAKTEPRG